MKRRDFICKEGADLYYLVNKGMGSFGEPPGHASHHYCIYNCRGGHVVGMMSLGYAAETEWLPKPVRSIARIYLEGMPGEVQPT
jgi:hypothetical protein